jgi:NAD(P)-dependent dehydrogenase (short-subunit alcohol dehydrogenase family)
VTPRATPNAGSACVGVRVGDRIGRRYGRALGSFWAVTNPKRRQFHFPAIVYVLSKAAVSMLTVQYAKALSEIKFNAVEPGFTATDLTPFIGARQPVEKGAEAIVRMATIGKDGPTGTFQEGAGELAWYTELRLDPNVGALPGTRSPDRLGTSSGSCDVSKSRVRW